MKNRFFTLTLLMAVILFTSCAGSRSGYGNHKKGYGCPATANVPTKTAEKNKI